MKKIVIYLLCLIVLSSCASRRKIEKSSYKADTSIDKIDSLKVNIVNSIDTSKIENIKITVTEIEFYPADSIRQDTTKNVINIIDSSKVNVISIKNAHVKSIKQTVIESKLENKGVSKDTLLITDIKTEQLSSNIEQTIDNEIVPDKKSYRWHSIIFIVILACIAIIYFNRDKVTSCIKKIISIILRIF